MEFTGTAQLEVMVEAERYARFLRRLVQRHCPSDAKLAVDFGAGIGTFSDALDGRCPVICVEADQRQQRRLRERGHSVVALEEIADGSVDYIFTLNVLEHIEADVETLSALRRKLREGGVLFVYVPAFRFLWSSMDDQVGHVRRYTRASLLAALRRAGFAVDRSRYADSAGFFATLVFKALGISGGAINRRALIAFDRVAFPVGRVLDVCGAGLLFGKNVYCGARRN